MKGKKIGAGSTGSQLFSLRPVHSTAQSTAKSMLKVLAAAMNNGCTVGQSEPAFRWKLPQLARGAENLIDALSVDVSVTFSLKPVH